MKPRWLTLFLCLLALFLCFPPAARADMGTNPSVHIDVRGLAGQSGYAALLSPAPGANAGYRPARMDEEIWQALTAYEDPDGFRFAGNAQPFQGEASLAWGYGAPETFKVLVYLPASGSFLASGACERYAFDTYYTVTAGPAELTARASYDYTWELVSLLLRIAVTILAEAALAFVCGFRHRALLGCIVRVNAVTQTLLSLALGLAYYKTGILPAMAGLFLLELAVTAGETAWYAARFPRLSGGAIPKGEAAAYGVGANLLSFVAGLVVFYFVPGYF